METLGQIRTQRAYIERVRRDPRSHAMMQGWIAQATMEAEQRYPDRTDDRQRAHMAAERAIQLAMSFVLDNDGEYQALLEMNGKLLDASLEMANARPIQMVMPAHD